MKRVVVPFLMVCLVFTACYAGWLSGWGNRARIALSNSTALTHQIMQLDMWYGYPQIEEQGSFEWFASPAYYYNNKTYIGYYKGDDEDTVIRTWDASTLTMSEEVIVFENLGGGDDHSCPTIIVLQHQTGDNAAHNGKILISDAEHNGELYVRRSTYAEDISAWGSVVTVASSDCSYARLVETSDGTVWLLYRIRNAPVSGNLAIYYRTSTDAGATWSSATLLFNSGTGYSYGMYDTNADCSVIHAMFNTTKWEDSIDDYNRYADIYYAQYKVADNKWYKADGTTEITLPMDRSTAGKVPDLVHSTTDSNKIVGCRHRVMYHQAYNEYEADDNLTGGNVYMERFQASRSDTATQFLVKSGASGNAKIAIYADSSGSPGSLLNANNTGQAVSAGWNLLGITGTSITSGTYYWLAVAIDNAGAAQADNSHTTSTTRYQSITYSTYSFPDPAGSGYTSGNKPIGIQAYPASEVFDNWEFLWDIKCVGGSPYLISCDYELDMYSHDNPTNVYYHYYDGEWNTETVCQTGVFGDYDYRAGAIIDGSDANAVYACVPDGSSKNQLQKWAKSGGTWSKAEDITQASPGDSYRPMYVKNAPSDSLFKVLWCYTERYVNFTDGDWDSSLFAYPGYNNGANVKLNKTGRTDFGDIRFASSDGSTLLGYEGKPWITSKTDSWKATVKLRVPIIPASPDSAMIYVYYGNAGATYPDLSSDTEEENAVRIWRDDFTSLDSSIWATEAGSPAISSGELILGGNDAIVTIGTFPSSSISIRAKSDEQDWMIEIVDSTTTCNDFLRMANTDFSSEDSDLKVVFRDDFSANTLNASYWTVEAGAVTLSGGQATMGNTQNGKFVSKTAWGLGHEFRSRNKTSDQDTYFLHLTESTANDQNYALLVNSDTSAGGDGNTTSVYFLSAEDSSNQSTENNGWSSVNDFQEYYIYRQDASNISYGQGSNSNTFATATQIPDGSTYMLFNTRWDTSTNSLMTLDWAQVKKLDYAAGSYDSMLFQAKNGTSGITEGIFRTSWSDFRDTYFVYGIARAGGSVTYSQGENSATYTGSGVPESSMHVRLKTWNNSQESTLTIDYIEVEFDAAAVTSATVAALNTFSRPLDEMSTWNETNIQDLRTWNKADVDSLFSIGGY